jgi:hypothetical protein
MTVGTWADALSDNLIVKVFPVGVLLFNQSQLPSAIPFLNLLFAQDGFADIVVLFVVDQLFDVVLIGEVFERSCDARLLSLLSLT